MKMIGRVLQDFVGCALAMVILCTEQGVQCFNFQSTF